MRLLRLAPCHAALLAAFAAMPAQADLIFSEYVEGSSNNKALEIYNAGDAAVDLSAYKVEQYANGATSPNATFALSGTLAAGKTYVLAHATLAPRLGARVDQQAALAFNGDDAVVLRQGDRAIDRIGQVGFRPTSPSAWVGASGASTLDNTLRRKAGIATGDTAIDSVFDVDAQWEAFARDTFDGLGAHPGLATEEPGDGGAPVAQCGAAATPIADLQGRPGNTELQDVHVEAIVTASYTYENGFSGFFVQTADGERKRVAGVSEGLFVYAPGKTVQAGQRVHLVGTVSEFSGQTQLRLNSDIAVCAQDQAVQADTVTLPLPDGTHFAQYEGMLVEFRQSLVVNDVYDLARYGSIVLADALLPTPTHDVEPGTAAQQLAQAQARRRIMLDDGYNHQNPAVLPYPASGLSAANTLRRGYTTQAIRGVLDYRFDAWRVQPVPGAAAPSFEPAGNPRTAAPARTPDSDIRAVSFNVLNYFNGDGQGGGFPTSRGARSAEELKRQEDKIVAALQALDADILGLMEIENDGYGTHSAIAQLARRLGPDWRYVVPAGDKLGDDVITVALLYRQDKVSETGKVATLAIDDKNRMPLAQTFASRLGGQAVTVVVNHFKSKGCDNATGGDADQDDGQSCWNPTRLKAAQALSAWLAGAPTGVTGAGTLILGDLNSYAKEAPIAALARAGYADLLARDGKGAAYTYVFQGLSGYLDHALADAVLAPKVLKAQAWSINADEPLALQYTLQYKNDAQQAAFYAADAYRSSDHDPVIVDMRLASTEPGTPGEPGTPTEPGTPGGGETAPPTGGGGGALGLALLATLGWLRHRRGARPA